MMFRRNVVCTDMEIKLIRKQIIMFATSVPMEIYHEIGHPESVALLNSIYTSIVGLLCK